MCSNLEAQVYDSARYKMATPASTFGYVAILSEPWNMQSTTAVDVNASIQLVLYSGTLAEKTLQVSSIQSQGAAWYRFQVQQADVWRGVAVRLAYVYDELRWLCDCCFRVRLSICRVRLIMTATTS